MIKANDQSPGGWYDGIALVRIIFGVMLILHGVQLFKVDDMRGYADMLSDRSIPLPLAMAYAGKMVELVGGFFLVLGLFTRLMTTLIFITFIFITFVMGEGKIFTDNQHPFLLALMALLFFFTGAGRVSIDHVLLINRKDSKKDSGIPSGKEFGRYVSKS